MRAGAAGGNGGGPKIAPWAMTRFRSDVTPKPLGAERPSSIKTSRVEPLPPAAAAAGAMAATNTTEIPQAAATFHFPRMTSPPSSLIHSDHQDVLLPRPAAFPSHPDHRHPTRPSQHRPHASIRHSKGHFTLKAYRQRADSTGIPKFLDNMKSTATNNLDWPILSDDRGPAAVT